MLWEKRLKAASARICAAAWVGVDISKLRELVMVESSEELLASFSPIEGSEVSLQRVVMGLGDIVGRPSSLHAK